MKRFDRRVRNLDKKSNDLTFADVLNIDTTFSKISKDV